MRRRARTPGNEGKSRFTQGIMAACLVAVAIFAWCMPPSLHLHSHCQSSRQFNEHHQELSYPNNTDVAESAFTIVINTYMRKDLMYKSIDYYSLCPGVESLQVVWCESPDPPLYSDPEPPRAPVHFHVMPNCSLNNRFQPLPGLRTEAIFSVDDDIRIPCEDLSKAFLVWRANKRTLVGFYPRLHQERRDCRHRYMRTFDTLVIKGAYSIVLTKACFMHRDYLQQYTHGIPPAVAEYVDHERNCEDLAMQFAVSLSSGLPPIAVHSARKKDLGAGIRKQVQGISSATNHDSRRSQCLDTLVNLFGEGMPLITRSTSEDQEGWKLRFYALFAFLLN